MIKWYVTFEDDPESRPDVRIVSEEEFNTDALARFDSLARAGEIGGRAILGMWMIDHTGGADDVIRVHGLVPREYRPSSPAPAEGGLRARQQQKRPQFGRRGH